MTFHPVIVHFPVAALTIYVLLELIPFKKLTTQPYWFYVKAVFAIVGIMGAFAATMTGDGAKALVLSGADGMAHQVPNLRHAINVHENWADVTVGVFGILGGSYAVLWIDRTHILSCFPNRIFQRLWKLLLKLCHACVETKLVIFLALFGLLAITITGSLGGLIVYGPNTDPVINAVYNLLVK